ncbi:MAG: hypothetical protein R3C32_02280 [Chloroflexota bacterium]
MTASRSRLVVVHPWWDLWAHTAPPGLRSERMELARRIAGELGDVAEPVAVVEAGGLDEAAEVGRSLAARAEAEGPVDAILVVQTMAAPVGHTLAILDRLPRPPWSSGRPTSRGSSMGPSTTPASPPRVRPSAPPCWATCSSGAPVPST